jgi:hypothetical protein
VPVVITTGSTVEVANGVSMNLVGTFTNNGTLLVDSSPNQTNLTVTGTVLLEGGGNLVLTDAGTRGTNRIYGNTSGAVLDNIDNTISGAGEIFSNNGNMSFTNEASGIVDANGTHTLEIHDITVTNKGLLEATGAGGLEFTTATVNGTGNNNGGQIEAVGTGNNVYLNGADIVGGQLITTSGGLIATTGNGAQLDGSTGAPVVITAGSTVQISNGTSMNLVGTIDNQGTLSEDSTGNQTNLTIAGTVLLEGGGNLTLSDAGTNGFNRIYSNTSNSLLDNVDNTISGAGEIFSNNGLLALLNGAAGVIDANGTHALDIHDIAFTNYGLLEANGGTLLVQNANVSGNGEVEISGGGAALFKGSLGASTDFEGAGTLEVGQLYSGTISGMAGGDVVDLDYLPTPAVFIGTPPNPDPSQASSSWGPGTPTYSLVFTPNANGTGGTLTVEETETYTVSYFAGPLNGQSFQFQTTVAATSLSIAGSYTSSDFTVLGSDGHGGTLIGSTLAGGQNFVWASAVNGTWQTTTDWTPNGTPSAADNAALSANSAKYTVSDNVSTNVFTLTTASKATLDITGNTFTIAGGTGGGTSAGTVKVEAGATLDLEGIFQQASTGLVSAAGSGATINLFGGSILGGKLSLATGSTFTASSGRLQGVAVSSKGTIEAISGGKLDLANDIITGATLTTLGGGVIETVAGTGTTLSGGAISAGSNVTVVDNSTLTLLGADSNAGTLALASTGDPTEIVAGAAATTLTNTGTLSGAGQVGTGDGHLTLTNKGTVNATGTLVIDTGAAVANSKTLEATGTGTLVIEDSVTNSGTGTVKAAAAGSVVDLSGGSISGLTASITTGATLEATGGALGSTLSGMTVTDKGTLLAVDGTIFTLLNTTVNAAGGVVEANDPLVDNPSVILLDNAVINSGTLTTIADGLIETAAGTNDTLNGSAVSSGSDVQVTDNSTLTLAGTISNAGTLALTSTGDVTDVVATTAATKLINTGTVSGAGQVGSGNKDLTLTNNGTVDANTAGVLTIDTGNLLTNTGSLEADAGSGGLLIDDAVKNTAAAGTNGLFANGANMTVVGAVTGGGAATVAGATLEFEAAAAANVTFTAAANGTLKLDLAQSYVGTVAGFGSSDQIDLADFAFPGATVKKVTGTGAAGTTTNVLVSDGALSVTLKLLNQFANEFAVDKTAYTLKSDGAATPGTLFELAPGH